jgi:hypothetical protein
MPDDSPLLEHAQRVTAHAGSLIVWDQKTLHGSAPNNSKNNCWQEKDLNHQDWAKSCLLWNHGFDHEFDLTL